MAQQTALSISATPGRTQSFSAKGVTVDVSGTRRQRQLSSFVRTTVKRRKAKRRKC